MTDAGRDFTKDSVAIHIIATAAPGVLVMLMHTAYQLIDLYFVAKLGGAAVAGVSAAANVVLVVNALTQVLTAGTIALVAHAVGRRDYVDANLIFNQSLALSVVCGLALAGLVGVFVGPYMRLLAVDSATIDAGVLFVTWALPGFVLSLPMAVLSCTLRAAGIIQPTVAGYMLTVLANAILAPILILGWGTGLPLGVSGAGLATSGGVLVGVLFLAVQFHRVQFRMSATLDLLRPRLDQWRRVFIIGLPSGGEFAIAFLSAAVVYYVIRDFGAAAQAGYGIGSRLLQVVLVPIVAIGGSVSPIVGQNLGSQHYDRVQEAFRKGSLIGLGVMLGMLALLQVHATTFARGFGAESGGIAVASSFLRAMSWTLVLQCVVNVCLGVLQGLGNTRPALAAGAVRLLAFAVPALWLSAQSRFRIESVWHLLIVSVALQAITIWWLLRREFARRLSPIHRPRIHNQTSARHA